MQEDIADTKEYIMLAHDARGRDGRKSAPQCSPLDAREVGIGGKTHIIKTIMDVADHKNVGFAGTQTRVTWRAGFDSNFNLVKDKIFSVHMRDLYLEEYPFRKLLTRLNEIQFDGFCLAEIPESKDPVRVMKYFRALWLAYQGLL